MEVDMEVGEIWRVRNKNKDINSYIFCITDILDTNHVTVNVMFRWTELAGPSDVKLPHSFIGSRVVFSFELECTIHVRHLDKLLYKLDSEQLDYINKTTNVGPEYLDEYDVRYKYHEKIIEDMEGMQR